MKRKFDFIFSISRRPSSYFERKMSAFVLFARQYTSAQSHGVPAAIQGLRRFSASALAGSPGIPFDFSADRSTLSSYKGNPTFAQNLIAFSSREIANDVEDGVNAPSTLPYVVQIPAKDPSVSTFKRLTAIGKEYVKLYKTGIQNVWKNNKKAKSILKALQAKHVDELTSNVLEKQGIARIVRNIESKEQAEEPKTVEIQVPAPGNLTRSQYQLLLRTPGDFIKLPLFTVIFAIFFETTPILVLTIPHIVPSTCLLPRQQRNDITRSNKNISALKGLYAPPETEAGLAKTLSRSVHNLSKQELMALVKAVNLYSSLIPLALIPRGSMEARLKTYIDVIKCDDTLISWYGGVWALNSFELARACQARAISTDGLSDTQLRLRLLDWITNFTEGRFDAGFLLYTLSTSEEAHNNIREIAGEL